MAVREDILETIRRSCAADEPLLSEESTFDEISIDSLSFVDMIVELEDSYQIQFEDEELNIYGWNKVQDFIDIVERHIAQKIIKK